MSRVIFFAVCLIWSVWSAPSLAVSPPDLCVYAASDYDGDGWGWEPSSRGQGGVPYFNSCQVDSNSVQAPVVTNLETNTNVDLVRPYWNAYRDFEGRYIQCDFYTYSGISGYTKTLNFFYSNGFEHWSDQSFTTEHFPLQANFPWTGYARNFAYNGSRNTPVSYKQPLAYWTVHDGIYYSNAGNKQAGREHVLSGARYLELIDDHNGAVRFWNDQDRYGSNSYAECFDASGARFQPSGFPGEARPSAQAVETPLLAKAVLAVQPSDIINLETGVPVGLRNVSWNLTNLFDKTFTCQSFYWTNDAQFSPHATNNGLGYSTAISGQTAYYVPDRRTVLYASDYKTLSTSASAIGSYSDYQVYSGTGNHGSWNVVNGEMTDGPLSQYKFAETTSDETRFWKSSEAYDVCTDIPSDAIELTEISNNECIDSDGDGWGWDGYRSCRVAPVPANCIDTDGDGWGWDGQRSCRVDTTQPQPGTCIDTDGDGWGWDGERSCQVETKQPQSGTCIDTDGDGWGWNGTGSCRPLFSN